MIIDSLLEFADAESVVGAAGTALIGDVIDLGATPQDYGNGQPMYLVITVDTSIITAGTAGTIKFQLASDAQAAIATDGSATVHLDTGTFVTDDDLLNDLDAGAVAFVGAVPTGAGRDYERYLGILATIGTTAVSAGAISAFLTADPRRWEAYADGKN